LFLIVNSLYIQELREMFAFIDEEEISIYWLNLLSIYYLSIFLV